MKNERLHQVDSESSMRDHVANGILWYHSILILHSGDGNIDGVLTFLLAVADGSAIFPPPENVRLWVSVSQARDINTWTFTHGCVRTRFRVVDIGRHYRITTIQFSLPRWLGWQEFDSLFHVCYGRFGVTSKSWRFIGITFHGWFTLDLGRIPEIMQLRDSWK